MMVQPAVRSDSTLLSDVLGLSDLCVNYCCAATNFEETLLLPVCSGHDATSLWINLSSQRPQTLSPGIQSCNDYHQRAAVVVAVLLHHCLRCVCLYQLSLCTLCVCLCP